MARACAGVVGHLAVRHGHAELLQDGLALILVDFHDLVLAVIFRASQTRGS